MKVNKRVTAFLLCITFVLGMNISVYAHDVPDLNRTGTITVTMHTAEDIVGGGTLSIYRVGEIYEDDGNYSFVPTEEFKNYGVTFDDIQSKTLAANLAEYVNKQKISGTTEKVEADGKVRFEELELGLYLMVQEEAPEGYFEAEPFLVSLPYFEDGEYKYEVDASPKVELEKEPSTPSEPTKPGDPTLPQTGQVNWPIPVLAVMGLVLFGLGWILYFGKRSKNEK